MGEVKNPGIAEKIAARAEAMRAETLDVAVRADFANKVAGNPTNWKATVQAIDITKATGRLKLEELADTIRQDVKFTQFLADRDNARRR